MNYSNIVAQLTCHMFNYCRLTDWSRATPSRGHWRMYWHVQPGAEIQFSGRRFPLLPDCAVLIPPDTPIGRKLDNPVDSLYVHFSLGLPYDLLSGKVYSFPVAGYENHINTLRELLERDLPDSRKSPERVVLVLNALIFGLTAQIPDADWPRPPRDSRIRSVMQLMEKHLEKPLDNPALAARANMSVNAFIRKFTGEMGKAPQLYYLERRLLHAANLLQHTSQSIEEIAAACGFCDRSYFSRRFKAYFGTAPAAYRLR